MIDTGEDAKSTIIALREQSIQEIIMITGDNENTSKYIANELAWDS